MGAVAPRFLIGLVLCALSFPLLAESASARKVLVGMGDQRAEMFDDPRLTWLGIRKARLVVPWYIGTGRATPEEHAWADDWLTSARRAGVEPMVSFGHAFEGVARSYLPSVREFGEAVAAFRRRWPWVRVFVTWNEANICSQPTCHRPARAAK